MIQLRLGPVWRQWLPLWLSAAVFLLLNLGGFVIYRVVFAGEAAVSQEAVEQAQARLDELEAKSSRLAGFLERFEKNQHRMTELYETGFSTEEERLTDILREVKRLAREANLEPQATTYPEEALEDYDLSKRSFVFNVEGTYFDLRKLINSLELSEYFLTLEDVGLSESGGRGAGTRLRISLRISTLFDARGDSRAGGAATRASASRPAPGREET
jgi:hypothetical protein